MRDRQRGGRRQLLTCLKYNQLSNNIFIYYELTNELIKLWVYVFGNVSFHFTQTQEMSFRCGYPKLTAVYN